MYICLCHAVTDRHIQEAVSQGARELKDLRLTLRVSATCGKCASCARQCLQHNIGAAEPAPVAAHNTITTLMETL